MDVYLTPRAKIDSERITDLNGRTEAIKLTPNAGAHLRVLRQRLLRYNQKSRELDDVRRFCCKFYQHECERGPRLGDNGKNDHDPAFPSGRRGQRIRLGAMRLRVRSLASPGGWRVRRCRELGWRPVAAAPTGPLAGASPCATGVALEKERQRKSKVPSGDPREDLGFQRDPLSEQQSERNWLHIWENAGRRQGHLPSTRPESWVYRDGVGEAAGLQPGSQWEPEGNPLGVPCCQRPPPPPQQAARRHLGRQGWLKTKGSPGLEGAGAGAGAGWPAGCKVQVMVSWAWTQPSPRPPEGGSQAGGGQARALQACPTPERGKLHPIPDKHRAHASHTKPGIDAREVRLMSAG